MDDGGDDRHPVGRGHAEAVDHMGIIPSLQLPSYTARLVIVIDYVCACMLNVYVCSVSSSRWKCHPS